MAKTLIDERNDLQAEILQELHTSGYVLRKSSKNAVNPNYTGNNRGNYNPLFAMDIELLIQFLETTQKDEWERYKKFFAYQSTVTPEMMFVQALNNQIAQRSLIDVLKNGYEYERGHRFKLLYRKPSSKLNEDAYLQYEKNIFSVMDEVWISPQERVDLVIFLNGLAIVSFELKSNTSGQNYEDAIRQFRYARDSNNRLFLFKSGCLVNFAMDLNEVYMTTQLKGEATFFLPFNKGRLAKEKIGKKNLNNSIVQQIEDEVFVGAGNPDGVDGKFPIAYMWEDILQKDTLLDLITNFVFIESQQEVDRDTGRVSKPKERAIFPRLHQFDAVRKLCADVKVNHTAHNYLIQHSAGSGKTNTIAWLAHHLSWLHDDQDNAIFDTVLIITDRIVVDRQLQDAVRRIDHQNGLIRVIDDKCSSQDLKNALMSRTKIIGSTIQKFRFILEEVSSLKERHFAVIIDEAHSSTAGSNMAAVTRALNSDNKAPDSVEEQYIEEMRKSGKQDNLSVFAFTATPKPTTLELFGTMMAEGYKKAFHVYSMKQAIEEGFILDVLKNYITYDTFWQINKTISEDPTLKTSEAKRQIARFIALHETNIAQRIEIIIEHFRQYVAHQLDGKAKAMVVTSSREEAVKYRQAFDAYAQKKGYKDIHALVAFSGKVTPKDEPSTTYTEAGMNGISEDKLPKAFHDGDYQILLVANKYQTGYDEPRLCAMYILKSLSGVNAVQTLSRLNRIVNGQNKLTFVLDFANSYDDMLKSFAPFYTTTILANSPNSTSIVELWAKIKGYNAIDEIDLEKVFDYLIKDEPSLKDRKNILAVLNRMRQTAERALDETLFKEFKATIFGFIRCYEFMMQATCLDDLEMHKRYLAMSLFTEVLHDGKSGEGVDITKKIKLTHIVQKKTKEVKESPKISTAIVKLAQAEGFILAAPQEKKLSEIIEELNARFGKNFNEDVVVKSVLQVKDLLLKSPELKKRAKANTEQDFSYTFLDYVDNALTEVWAQNQEFVGLLLNNDELKKEMMGLFIPEVYRQLRESSLNHSVSI